MVRAKRKKANDALADFKRVKRKVGRKAPQRTTATETAFASRTVHVREQSLVADKGGRVVSAKNLTIPELLSKVKHHNAAVRKDALEGLAEIVVLHAPSAASSSSSSSSSSQPGANLGAGFAEVKAQLPTIVTTAAEVLNDADKSVRVTFRKLLESLLAVPATQSLGRADAHWCTPFLKLLMFHACAGLSGLQQSQRLDALRVVDILSSQFPQLVVEFESSLLRLFGALLESVMAQVGSKLSQNNTSSIRAQGGILAQFKQANKAKKRKGTKTHGSSHNAGGDDARSTGSSGGVVVNESCLLVTSTLLRFMTRSCSPDADEPRQAAPQLHRTLSPNAGAHTRSSEGEHNAVPEEGSQNVDHACGDSPLGPLMATLTTLWTQAGAVFASVCDSSRARLDRAQLEKALEQLRVAAKLLRAVSRRVAPLGPLGVVQERHEMVVRILENFPLPHEGHFASKVDFGAVHLSLVDAVMSHMSCCAASPGFLDGCKLGQSQGNISKLVTWLTKLLRHNGKRSSTLASVALQGQLVPVVAAALALPHEPDCCVLSPQHYADLKAGLAEAFTQTLQVQQGVDAELSTVQVLREVASLMHHHPDFVSEDQILALPRLIWACASREDSSGVHVAQSALELLRHCVLALPQRPCWPKVLKHLVPLFYTKTKSQQKGLFGPFTSAHVDADLRLLMLDTVAMIPVEQQPEPFLRALVRCVAHPTLCLTEHAVLRRAVQLPFYFADHKLRSLTALGPETCGELVGDVASFAVSILVSLPLADVRADVVVPLLAQHLIHLAMLHGLGEAVVEVLEDALPAQLASLEPSNSLAAAALVLYMTEQGGSQAGFSEALLCQALGAVLVARARMQVRDQKQEEQRRGNQESTRPSVSVKPATTWDRGMMQRLVKHANPCVEGVCERIQGLEGLANRGAAVDMWVQAVASAKEQTASVPDNYERALTSMKQFVDSEGSKASMTTFSWLCEGLAAANSS